MVLKSGKTIEHACRCASIIEAPQQDYTRALVAMVRSIDHGKKNQPAAPLLRVDNMTARYPQTGRAQRRQRPDRAGQTLAVVGESGP
jgi:peptide/nickel transport system ATP-binding protein